MPHNFPQWMMVVLFLAWCCCANYALFRHRKVNMDATALLLLAFIMQLLLLLGGFYNDIWRSL